MTIDTYLNFILVADDVETRADGSIEKFEVQVFDSPAGQGEFKQTVTVPEGLLDDIGFLESRSYDENVEEQMDLGERLAKLLLPEEHARTLFSNSLNRLGLNQGLRLWLRLADELTDFPWEFMYIQAARGDRSPSSFLALDPRISIVRHLNLAEPADWFETGDRLFDPPSRRLVVAMASPEPYNEKHPMLKSLPDEQKALKVQLRDVPGMDTVYLPEYNGPYENSMPGASMNDIFDALMKHTDIFHFSGHGDYSGALELAGMQNKILLVDADRFAETLQGNGVRLAVMGACHTGRRDGRNVWTGTVASMLKVGIPAVLAMQFPIFDDLTAIFMAYFYRSLIGGQTLDQAAVAGRKAIRTATIGNDKHLPDWGVPVLYLRTHNSRVFQPVANKDIQAHVAHLSDGQARLYYIWWGWETLGETANDVQLDKLDEVAAGIDIPPTQLVLLLRSTLEQHLPSTPWIEHLREKGGDFIQKLDDHLVLQTTLPDAVILLGLDEQTQENRPIDTGPVAWAAVQHNNHLTRKTAALSLTAIQPAPITGLDRLSNALKHVGGRWSLHRWNLQSELHGTLADADRTLEIKTGQLPPINRFGVWFWRFRQRLYQDRERIAFLVLGAAMGAGLALGLWRAVIAAIAPAQTIAVRFAISLFWGALLGGCVGLAIGLSRPLMVSYPEWKDKSSHDRQEYGDIKRKQAWMAAILGVILFGVAHVFVALSNGLPLDIKWLVLITGAIAGFGINLALYGQPQSKKPGVGSWLSRLVIAALFVILAQWLVFKIQPLLPEFTLSDELWAVSSITRRGGSYADYFANFSDLNLWFKANQDKVSFFDAIVVNMLMTIGITLGIYKGMEWLAQWIGDDSD